MRVTLELRATDEAQRPKRACWFPAHWPEPWYAALARSAVDHESVACRVGDDVLIAATNDGEAAALKLWTETGVRVLPGAYLSRETAQGNPGKDYIRVALVAPQEETQRGLTLLRDCLYR